MTRNDIKYIIKEILSTCLMEDLNKISLQQAIDKKYFGPVYHGTTSDKLSQIEKDGFKVFYGKERSGDVSHGYEMSNYFNNIPAPIHHLGFGIYFTTNLSIAKQFAFNTSKGVGPYFLDIPRLETINFGAPKTMMKWWKENGYDYKETPQTLFGSPEFNRLIAERERYAATVNMTNVLKHKFDGVWYKGKGMGRLLDGDQVVVFNPGDIYKIDKSLIKPGEIGSKVKSKIGIDRYNTGKIDVPQGTKGIIIKKELTEPILKQYPLSKNWIQDAKEVYTIKWDKGGTMSGVLDKWIDIL